MVSNTSHSPAPSAEVVEVLAAVVVAVLVEAVEAVDAAAQAPVAVRPRLARPRKRMAVVPQHHRPQVVEVAVVPAVREADKVVDVVLLRLRVRNLLRVGCSCLFWMASPS
jgi:hypothetical protein